MIGVTISKRQPRGDVPYSSLQPGSTYDHSTPDGIFIRISNTTGKPIFLKWRS